MLPIGLQHKWYSGGRQKVLSAIVRDANRQALAYVYFEEEPGRRAAARLLTHDEARRIAANKPFDLGQSLPCALFIDCVRPANGGRVNQRSKSHRLVRKSIRPRVRLERYVWQCVGVPRIADLAEMICQ
jgi:hypothetical protein